MAKIHRVEGILLAVGFALVGVWGAARFHRSVASRVAISEFHEQTANTTTENLSASADSTLGAKVDFQLWSVKRIQAYEASLSQKKDAPLAVLRVPKINLEVPVFNDTDDLTLNRGVGRILGTAHIGAVGNIGIAGHRDGFFRGLKDVGPGDIIELEIPGKTEHYVVKQIQIVKPEDVYVLAPTAIQTVTLVTCFPFYYVGSAPERYVVTATIQSSGQRD